MLVNLWRVTVMSKPINMVYVVERKDLVNQGCVLNKYIGDCGEGTRGYNVDFDKAYKFYDKESALWFIEHQAMREDVEFFNPEEYCVTGHEMVS